MDSLIFDRLRRDVELVLERPNSSEFRKGAYNYTDLNRVEEWCEFIQEILNDYAKNISIEVKVDWNLKDFTFREQIDRIRNNIEILRNACYAIVSSEIIEYNNTLNYEQANILEKILFDIAEYIKEMTRTVELQYDLGSNLDTVKNIDITINTDTLIENREVAMNENVATSLFSRKYMKMEAI